jgi:hypothetical protein
MVAAGARRTRVTGGAPIAAGITVDEALQRLGLDPAYAGGASGRAELTGVGGVQNAAKDPNRGLWTAVGSAIGLADDSTDFPDILLRPGDPSTSFPGDHGAIILTYLDDADHDGVPGNFETLNGTNPEAVDTDGDGLSDRFETKVGWTVPLVKDGAPDYHVYSSPLTCDADGDGSPDGPGKGNARYGACPRHAPEYNRGSASGGFSRLLVPRGPDGDDGLVGTDPKLVDSNQDGLNDWPEPYPQVLDQVDASKRAPVPVRQYGGAGRAGGGQFNTASALAMDHGGPTNQVYVATPEDHGISVFDSSSAAANPFVGQITSSGHGLGAVAVSPVQVSEGKGVNPTVGSRGFVGWAQIDGGIFPEGRVKAFQSTTRHDMGDSFKVYDGIPGVTRQMHLATDVSPGNVYVATSVGSKDLDVNVAGSMLNVYSPSGKLLRRIGRNPSKVHGKYVNDGKGDLRVNPTGVAVDREGNIFVSEGAYPFDWGIRKYDARTGNLDATYRSDQMRKPTGIGVDGNGYVYVTLEMGDGGAGNRVVKFSNNLTYLTSFGGSGRGRGLFDGPYDVDSNIGWGNTCGKSRGSTDGGSVAVLDQGNHLVQEFAYPLGEGGPDPATCSQQGR